MSNYLQIVIILSFCLCSEVELSGDLVKIDNLNVYWDMEEERLALKIDGDEFSTLPKWPE